MTVDNTKGPNIHVNGVTEGKEGEKGAEKHYWRKNSFKKFPNVITISAYKPRKLSQLQAEWKYKENQRFLWVMCQLLGQKCFQPDCMTAQLNILLFKLNFYLDYESEIFGKFFVFTNKIIIIIKDWDFHISTWLAKK